MNDLDYFSALLPWQTQAWEQVITQFHEGKLPHGILACGMAGIGKRKFVWRMVAWLLCQNRTEQGACGRCDDCHWLASGTHPDLMVLPSQSLPTAEHRNDKVNSIKIDDIRALQEYSHVKGHGVRLIILDHADTLTMGASNALLKTLEEPQAGVHLILISNHPTRLLPTIKSRVQALPLRQISYHMALDFVTTKLNDDQDMARLCLDLADGAVLLATDLPKKVWFDKRELWIKTWLALRHDKRSPISASDYWQQVMDLNDFLVLTRLMFIDIMRVGLGLDSRHTDINVQALLAQQSLNMNAIEQFCRVLDDVVMAMGQNVQHGIAYDELFYELARL